MDGGRPETQARPLLGHATTASGPTAPVPSMPPVPSLPSLPSTGPTAARRRVPLRTTCAQPHPCPLPVRLSVLSRVPLFAGLTRGQLVAIDHRMVSLSWARDDVLYRAGDPADHLYVMATGRAKASRTAPTGQEVVVDLLAPGALVGGLQAAGHARYEETVRALTTTCALRIDVADFRELLTQHPAIALRVIDETAALLAQARRAVTDQATTPVAQRVAGTLLRLADTFGQDRASGATLLELPLSRADLAGMTGSTPESVSRVMSRLRREGVIDSGRRWTAVLDRDRLAAVAAGEA